MKPFKTMGATFAAVLLLGISFSARAQYVTIQENTLGFCRVEGSVDSNHGGFTGAGFANANNASGAGVDWSINAPASGVYQLEWRFANGASDRPGTLKINGANVTTVGFPSTGAWNSWTTVNTMLSLSAGRNSIRLEATTSAGLANIDWLAITGASAPQAADCGTAGTDGDYYVAPGGSNSNPGTIDRPFASLQKAIDVAQPGDLVYVRGGVYNITNPAIPSAGINFWKSGSSDGNRIRYFAYPGERPVLDFSNLRIQPDPEYTFGVLVSGSYLHLKGFEIRNVPMNTRSNTGVRVGGDAYRNIFELLDIHHIQGTGMFIHTTRGGHLILNSDSHDNYDPRSHQGDGQNGDGFGVHYQTAGDVTVFRGCRAWWNSDDGWDFISQEVPVIVENSWAMGSGYINSGTARAQDGNGAGFKIGSSKTGIRHVVRNNLAWGNRSQGFYANHSAGGNDWFNNTSYNNGVQYDLLASSWDANGNRTDGVILTGDKVHRMRNNIGYPNSNRNMQGVQSSFNTWDLGLAPASSDFESLSDSGFMGPRNTDGSLPNLNFLKLRAGSRMIDRGTNVGLPYSGAAPDLGAYER
ncbi:carbohydrate-binding protein [Steroidobacter sp. S1-65]|uniref:Carbohydrate-binding protein n=1 Tax=Steroidobacter gossypii TaxID=2805490 RepID=A0ABS1WVK0_9GAMM|nr:carbohydrate-binding protein [Steroidobacter gossypii]MBM0105004.1 carbohydrate-binding protein [Steroidobacter gossypii]